MRCRHSVQTRQPFLRPPSSSTWFSGTRALVREPNNSPQISGKFDEKKFSHVGEVEKASASIVEEEPLGLDPSRQLSSKPFPGQPGQTCPVIVANPPVRSVAAAGEASGAAATMPVPLCFGIWIRHIEDEPRTTADRQPLPPGRGVPSGFGFRPSFRLLWLQLLRPVSHPSIDPVEKGRPHVNRKNNVTDNRRAQMIARPISSVRETTMSKVFTER